MALKIKNIIVLIAVVFSIKTNCQNYKRDIDKLKQKLFSNLLFFKNKDSLELIKYSKFSNYIEKLRTGTKNLNKTSGKIDLSFKGNDNYNTQDRFDFVSSLKLVKGSYPYKIKLNAMISAQFINGTLQENISAFHMGFDFHLKDKKKVKQLYNNLKYVKDNLLWEGYVYADRYSNQYLNIEQKYEIGSGFIINFYSGRKVRESTLSNSNLARKIDKKSLKHLVKEGQEELQKIYSTRVKVDSTYVMLTNEKSAEIIDYPNFTSNDSITIYNEFSSLSNALRKKYSKTRFALLTGLFYEIEKGNARDSIRLSNGETKLFTEKVPTTNFLRWQIRPTFEYYTGAFELKLKPYFKLPMPWDWISEEVYEPENQSSEIQESNRRFDLLIDLQFSMAYYISQKFSINFQVRHIFDNAPKRTYLDNRNSPELLENIVLLTANSNHTFFNFSLGYNL